MLIIVIILNLRAPPRRPGQPCWPRRRRRARRPGRAELGSLASQDFVWRRWWRDLRTSTTFSMCFSRSRPWNPKHENACTPWGDFASQDVFIFREKVNKFRRNGVNNWEPVRTNMMNSRWHGEFHEQGFWHFSARFLRGFVVSANLCNTFCSFYIGK